MVSYCFRCATKQQPCALPRGACKSRHDTGIRAFPSHLLLRCLRALVLPEEYESFLRIELDFCWKMLRVIVESACGIPKKKLGNPDPIAAVVFRGERHHWHALSFLFFSFFYYFIYLLWSILWLVISNRQLNLSMSWFLKCAIMCKWKVLILIRKFYQSSVSRIFCSITTKAGSLSLCLQMKRRRPKQLTMNWILCGMKYVKYQTQPKWGCLIKSWKIMCIVATSSVSCRYLNLI